MTEETESLVLEILKRLQSEFALMREDMRGMRAEMISLKQQAAAFVSNGSIESRDGWA